MSHYHDDAIKEQQDSRVAECYRRACAVQEERNTRLEKMQHPYLTVGDILLSRGYMERLFHAVYRGDTFWHAWYKELLERNHKLTLCP